MIYTCNACRFTFEWDGEIDQCPDCGKFKIREATEQEKEEYRKNKEEQENNPL